MDHRFPRISLLPWALVLTGTALACAESAPPPAEAETGGGGTEQAEIAPSPLWGTAWVLEDLAGTPPVEGKQATLEFPEPGKAAGSGSCNRFFGAVEISGDAITFKAMATTRMACGEAAGKQESAYLKALQEAERFEIDGDALLIYAQELEAPLRFKARAP